MYPTDSAVSVDLVTKTFTQWQRDNTGRGLLKNLLKPEKRIVTALDKISMKFAGACVPDRPYSTDFWPFRAAGDES